MLWVVVWVVLGMGACLTLFLLGRRLWRQLKALTRELRAASERLGQITDRLAALERSDGPQHRAPR